MRLNANFSQKITNLRFLLNICIVLRYKSEINAKSTMSYQKMSKLIIKFVFLKILMV